MFERFRFVRLGRLIFRGFRVFFVERIFFLRNVDLLIDLRIDRRDFRDLIRLRFIYIYINIIYPETLLISDSRLLLNHGREIRDEVSVRVAIYIDYAPKYGPSILSGLCNFGKRV